MRRLANALLLATALAANIGHATTTPLDRIAVVVDESAVMESDVQKRMADVRSQFEQSGQPLPGDEVLRKQVIEQLVLETIQLNIARQSGIKIDDAALDAQLTDIAKRNNQTLEQFQEQLDKTPGSSYAEVRNQIRNDMMINRLRERRMQETIHISDQDVQSFLKSPQGQAALTTEYHLAHILVALPEAASPEQIDEAAQKAADAMNELKAGKSFAQVAAHYSSTETALKGGDLGWRKAAELPTLFTSQVETMKAGELLGPLRTPGGFHIVKLLEKRGDTLSVTQYHVRHILVKSTEILSSEDAHQELVDIRNKILKGEDFGKEARLHSDDPGSARNGGELGWVGSGEMVPEFERQMLAAKPGQLSEVFQSPYGWHILEVEGVRQQDMSQQYRENLARQALYERRVDEELANWMRELRGDAYVDIKEATR